MTLHQDSGRKHHASWRDRGRTPALVRTARAPQTAGRVALAADEPSDTRTEDGQSPTCSASTGLGWRGPAGADETRVGFDGPMACLHVFLPAFLLEHSALVDGLEPSGSSLSMDGGRVDPVTPGLGDGVRRLIGEDANAADRMLVDGLRSALAARLGVLCPTDRERSPCAPRALDPRRLRRVLDLIEARLSEDLSLDDLASEACLSPFHFSRLFRQATGTAPHRYLTDRRVQAAKAMLEDDASSLVEIGLCVGLGAQANFTRAFRKTTGMTPGQYRTSWRQRARPSGIAPPGPAQVSGALQP